MGLYTAISTPVRIMPWVGAWFASLVFSGCVAPIPNAPPTCRPVSSAKQGTIADVKGKRSSSGSVRLASGELLPVQTHALTAEQVRCQAATAATLARLTEMERGLACELHQGDWCLTPNQKCLEQELLWLRTQQQGNQAASTALEVFYRLSEAQQQAKNLTARRGEIESTQADLKELKSHDLPVEQEPAELDRQLLSIQEAQASLDSGMAQGWAQLQVLLGSTFPEEIPEMQVGSGLPPSPPETAEAVPVAWQRHPELRTLQVVIQRLTPETLPFARGVLQQYDGGLGTVQPAGFGVQAQQLLKVFCIFRPNRCPLPSQARELEVRKVQLFELLAEREKAVAAEVETAIVSWKTGLRQWQLANQRLQSWQTQLNDLTRKQPVDQSITAFDLAKARMGILEAKSDCLKFAFEVRQAQVKLWTAQGVASAGCGLTGEESGPGDPGQWLQSDVPGNVRPGLVLPLSHQTDADREITIRSCRPLSRRN